MPSSPTCPTPLPKMQHDYNWSSSRSHPINIPGAVPRSHQKHVSQHNDHVILSSTRTRRSSHGSSSAYYLPESPSKHAQRYNDQDSNANMSFVVPIPQSFLGATQPPRGSRHTNTQASATQHVGYTISCSYCRSAIPERGMQAHLKVCSTLASELNSPPMASHSAGGRYPYVYSAPSSHTGGYHPLTPPSPQWNEGYYSPGHANVSLDGHGWLPSPSHTTAATSPSQSRHIALPEVPEDEDYHHPPHNRLLPFDRPTLDNGKRYHSDYPTGSNQAFPSAYAADGSHGYSLGYHRTSQSLDDHGLVQQQAYLRRGRTRHRHCSMSSHPGFND
jgi:hypothetical protein